MTHQGVPLPLVSLIITSYNRAGMIGRAIESALAQDYPNLEIIISDNASTDATDDVVAKYESDPRIKYFKNETNIGMLPNFAKATKEFAQGEFITYVSSDDYLINDSFVTHAVEKFLQYSDLVIVQGAVEQELVNLNAVITPSSYTKYKNSFYKRDIVPGKEIFLSYPVVPAVIFGGAVFRKNELIKRNPFNGIILADAQIILQLVQLGDVAFLNEKTYMVRFHGGNATGNVNAQIAIDNVEAYEVPYRLALDNQFIDRYDLKKWRFDMLYSYYSMSLDDLYKKNKREFRSLSLYLNGYCPDVYRKIISRPSWYLLYLVYFNQNVGCFFSSIRRQLGRLKRGLKFNA